MAYAGISILAASCSGEGPKKMNRSDQALHGLSGRVADLQVELTQADSKSEKGMLRNRIAKLEEKIRFKREARSLPNANRKIMEEKLKGHTKLNQLVGTYKVLVIPVQFDDVKFDNVSFFTKDDKTGLAPAHDYLFGDSSGSMTQYYRHASLGQFDISGEVFSPVTVDKNLAFYGAAVTGSNDANARKLVVDAVKKAMASSDLGEEWWQSFDQWDLNDFDGDGVYHEPDGFMDALVLVYAGKSQASCQRSFDPNNERPASEDVEEGPRHDAAVECFNRIWPHRWSLSISANDPDYSKVGPVVDGIQRPSLNGLKITDNLFAVDYNMQSEYSDRSTFNHEYGHSLGLPDVYAMKGVNSSGQWELMSSNAPDSSQEFSTYSKLHLGWLSPKILYQGEEKEIYLGAYNFVSNERRDDFDSFRGPVKNVETIGDEQHSYDILSYTPGTRSPVYRSAIALTDPEIEEKTIAIYKENNGHFAAYSDRFDGEERSITLDLQVPENGDMQLSFDTIYHIETETNFEGKKEEIKVITDFDIGEVFINDSLKEELRLISGDTDYDSLADLNPECEYNRVLELRSIKNSSELSDTQKEEFKEKLAVCRKPIWVKKAYDLSAHAGETVTLKIKLKTDGGYTEFGIIVDNIKLGNQFIDFENSDSAKEQAGDFAILEDGIVRKSTNQFYLFEYRNPGEEFTRRGKTVSYNMDNNINSGSQSFFTDTEGSSTDRFRLVRYDYQPGVLVWYFNSKYDRISNNPLTQGGKGYLLVLNANQGELTLPGVMNQPWLFDENGHYATESSELKSFVEEQRSEFVCFSHVDYYTYVNGAEPDCTMYPELDLLKELSYAGKSLVYRREGLNEVLPQNRFSLWGVGVPMRNTTTIRTGLSTFRPADSAPFKPFKVFKAEGGDMVLDKKLTAEATSVAPVSKFDDRENSLSKHKRFIEDSVVVEKRGFSFEIKSPEKKVLKSYNKKYPVNNNNSYFRRPRVKLDVNWN